MQKAFLLYEAKDVSDYCMMREVGLSAIIVGVFSASSIQEAAHMIGGELEYKENEIIIWLPAAQFKEVWNGIEYDRAALDVLSKQDEHPANFVDANFDKYIWISPWGEIPLETVVLLPNKKRDKKGLAICEVPLIA